MKAKASLFRTLLVVPVAVLVAVAVALFGVGLRTAETQTTPSYYEVQVVHADFGVYGASTTPYSMNDSGHAVGMWDYYAGRESGYHYAFLYQHGQMNLIGSYYSSANAINDSSQVVGYSSFDPANYALHAFLYDSSNGMKDLGTLPQRTDSWASAINDSGQVVGSSATLQDDGSYQNSRGFLYDSTNGMKDLGALPDHTDSRATAMNNSGQVVGYSYALQDNGNYQNYRAFLYKDGKMTDLGTFGGTYSSASHINNSSQVVGGSLDGSGQHHAFLYQNEEMIDLGNRWFPDCKGSGWNLSPYSSNYRINNEGQILVGAWPQEDGDPYTEGGALLLTPTSDSPPPADCQAPSPPTITSPQNNAYDTDGSFSVSGSAEAGSTVELFEGTTSTGKTTTADSSTGAWSIDLSGVSEGAHTYTAKAKDAAGNTSPASNTVTVTVDRTAPTVSSLVATDKSRSGVPLRKTNFLATFSEPMDTATLNTSTFKLYKCASSTDTTCTTQVTNVTVTPGSDSDALSATLDPSKLLEAKTKYKVIVSTGAKDLAGNALAQQKDDYFTTGST